MDNATTRALGTIVYSTSGTAPLRIVPLKRNDYAVWLELEDGSGQIYDRAGLASVMGGGGFALSTSGTAPVRVDVHDARTVYVSFEDGGGQVYDRGRLLGALAEPMQAPDL